MILRLEILLKVKVIYQSNSFILYSIDYRLRQRQQWQPTPVLLPGESHGRRSLIGCSPLGHWESDTTKRLHFHFSLSCIGEGNGNPLQYSCLENPRDGEPAGLPSLGLDRVGHDWSDLAAAAYTMGLPWWLSWLRIRLYVGDLGSVPGLGRSSGEGKGYPLQYSGLENSMDCIVHGVAKHWTWLNDFHFTSLL